MSLAYYPISPNLKNKNLTQLPASYKLRASLAVLAIIMFFALYAGLVMALGYLAYYAVIYDMGPINKLTIILKIGAIAGSVMLFVFTLKFIFKLKNPKRTNRIKLAKSEQPELWAFVDQICKETGAPKPKNIYIDPDVNAYVAYSNMWLSLFLPIKKELTIGLGLVSCLNLSEFKAVVTHEFGHFAQSSMKIGSYIISANTIIHDMIFDRDKWDELLDQWRGSDIRLSFAAWAITPIIWIIRQLLSLFYQFLNIMYSSLSREMEFNADKVAVSTTGSDAIVSALWKLDDGSTNWNSTLNHAYLASNKKMFVDNLYSHNNMAIARGADKQDTTLANLPMDERGGKLFFSTSETSKVGMYASHPPNDLRENNAKIPYIACEEDDRSPWLLFANDIALQTQMTKLVYKEYFSKTPENHDTADAFETFILEENKGKDLLEEYDNTFENRFFNIETEEILHAEAEKVKNITHANIKILKAELTLLMLPIKEIEKLMMTAQQISEGTTNQKTFAFQGTQYKKKTLKDGYEKLVIEREKLFNDSFKSWDLKFCATQLALAKKNDCEETLMDMYLQHKEISSIYRSIVAVKNTVYADLNHLQSLDEVSKYQISEFSRKANTKILSLNDELDRLQELDFVSLPNIDSHRELRQAIIANGEFKAHRGSLFENNGFGELMTQVETALANCQRVDQKSISNILLFQKGLIVEQD